MANPTLLTSPIAENGDKNVIPATTGATTGLLDQEHGFQQINELPLQAGGLPPQRKDFNGAFNLLSKIIFYAQKGYVFDFDENQDYYASCIVKDTDGGLYCANADVPASSTQPKDDPTNWSLINFGFNKKETFTSSGSFTAPVTGTYRITLQGGGGGGSGAFGSTHSGGGGGSGACFVFYEKLTAGTSYSYTIGAGGAGGAVNAAGGNGGDSSIVIGNNTYTASHGGGSDGTRGGGGGYAKVNGTNIGVVGFSSAGGHCGVPIYTSNNAKYAMGAMGGFGLTLPNYGQASSETYGRGGTGGSVYGGTPYNGGDGGNGYIQFEYCDMEG